MNNWKKRLRTALLCLLLLLSGCRAAPTEEPDAPLHLENLAVELSRNGLEAAQLMQAVKTLPEQLQTCLQKNGVEVEHITVSVGTSPAATAQALSDGSVDLAFLPAEDFLAAGTPGTVLLGDAPQAAIVPGESERADWNMEQSLDETAPRPGGTVTLIAAGPSTYGVQLSHRSTPTWEELSRANWGVLHADSLNGYRGFVLWLQDAYEGSLLSELPDVTEYDSYEALFRAAANGEIDAFPMRADARLDFAEVWTMEPSKTADGGLHGMGRTEPIWQEVFILGATEPLYTTVAAVSSDRTDLQEPSFQTALDAAVRQLGEKEPSDVEVLGAAQFSPICSDDLNPMRRLLTAEGVSVLPQML